MRWSPTLHTRPTPSTAVPTTHPPTQDCSTSPGWEQMPVTAAAQAVQRSAFPNAYAKHEARAAAIVEAITGAAPDACRPLARGQWVLPLAEGSYRLTSGYGPRTHPIRGTTDFHSGLDMAAPHGTRVVAVTDGEVIFAGAGGGYGNLVKVRHTNGVESWFAHLSAISVQQGQQLQPGDELGRVGSTGSSTGPHLHLEIRVDGRPTDPALWLRSKGLTP